MNKAPSLFIGHGSPMNAIDDNAYTRSLHQLGGSFEKPKAIVVISAHWLSAGTWVTHMKHPRTIHDFYGFPEKLYGIQYTAPGSPITADLIQSLSDDPKIQLDDQSWGLDHGTWSVLTHLYPKADIPVVQLSIDMSEPPEFHFGIGEKLKALRAQGIMILGSGNIVHNLRQIKWEPDSKPHAWCVEFDEWVKSKLVAQDYNALMNDYLQSTAGQLSVPTPDHYLPMLYVLGASDSSDQLHFEFEGLQNGSISMRSFSLGL